MLKLLFFDISHLSFILAEERALKLRKAFIEIMQRFTYFIIQRPFDAQIEVD